MRHPGLKELTWWYLAHLRGTHPIGPEWRVQPSLQEMLALILLEGLGSAMAAQYLDEEGDRPTKAEGPTPSGAGP